MASDPESPIGPTGVHSETAHPHPMEAHLTLANGMGGMPLLGMSALQQREALVVELEQDLISCWDSIQLLKQFVYSSFGVYQTIFETQSSVAGDDNAMDSSIHTHQSRAAPMIEVTNNADTSGEESDSKECHTPTVSNHTRKIGSFIYQAIERGLEMFEDDVNRFTEYLAKVMSAQPRHKSIDIIANRLISCETMIAPISQCVECACNMYDNTRNIKLCLRLLQLLYSVLSILSNKIIIPNATPTPTNDTTHPPPPTLTLSEHRIRLHCKQLRNFLLTTLWSLAFEYRDNKQFTFALETVKYYQIIVILMRGRHDSIVALIARNARDISKKYKHFTPPQSTNSTTPNPVATTTISTTNSSSSNHSTSSSSSSSSPTLPKKGASPLSKILRDLPHPIDCTDIWSIFAHGDRSASAVDEEKKQDYDDDDLTTLSSVTSPPSSEDTAHPSSPPQPPSSQLSTAIATSAAPALELPHEYAHMSALDYMEAQLVAQDEHDDDDEDEIIVLDDDDDDDDDGEVGEEDEAHHEQDISLTLRDSYHLEAQLWNRQCEFVKGLLSIQNAIALSERYWFHVFQVYPHWQPIDDNTTTDESLAFTMNTSPPPSPPLPPQPTAPTHGNGNDESPQSNPNDSIPRWVQKQCMSYYMTRGTTYSNLGEYQLGFADSDLCVMLKPNDANQYVNRAFSYYELGAYDDCIKDCNLGFRVLREQISLFLHRKSTPHSPLNAPTAVTPNNHTNTAAGVVIMDDTNDTPNHDTNNGNAMDDSDDMLSFTPDRKSHFQIIRGLLYGNRGLAESKLGEYNKAIDDLNLCIELVPQSRLAREALEGIWNEIVDACNEGLKNFVVDNQGVPDGVCRIIAFYAVGIDFEITEKCHPSTLVFDD